MISELSLGKYLAELESRLDNLYEAIEDLTNNLAKIQSELFRFRVHMDSSSKCNSMVNENEVLR